MEFIDYYKILEIQKTSTEADIKAAYRKLARKYHPDLNPNDENAKKKFQQINEANEVLSDSEKERNTISTVRIGSMRMSLKKQISNNLNHELVVADNNPMEAVVEIFLETSLNFLNQCMDLVPEGGPNKLNSEVRI